MRILFIGDIVGRSGRNVLLNHMPKLIAEWSLDLVVVNGENEAPFGDQLRHVIEQNVAPATPDNVADEEDSHITP